MRIVYLFGLQQFKDDLLRFDLKTQALVDDKVEYPDILNIFKREVDREGELRVAGGNGIDFLYHHQGYLMNTSHLFSAL